MNINPYYITPQKEFSSQDKHVTKARLVQNRLPFKGHYGSQILYRNGERLFLRNQTGLFRDIGTKNAVKDYIISFWQNKTNVKMLIGGCSTGEEAYTYSMLLKSIKPQVSILGFDLSPNAIKLANSRKIIMERAGKYIDIEDLRNTSYYDSCLCFKSIYHLNSKDMEYKKLFDEFFEISQEVPERKIWGEIVDLKKTFWDKVFNRDSLKNLKIVKLNKGKALNCRFVEGDIRDLHRVTHGKKADIITFSNAMYHLTTEQDAQCRVKRKNSEQIIRQVINSVKQNLKEKGLFVLGEEEIDQMLDDTLLPKVLKELGFTPIYGKLGEIPSVWCLGTPSSFNP